MGYGVLLWGFQNPNIVASLSMRLKKIPNISEIYIQIASNEKVSSLLDTFPQEIIRSSLDNVELLHNWLEERSEKKVIVIFNFWSFLTVQNYNDKFQLVRNLVSKNFKLIFVAPKLISNIHLPFFKDNNVKLLRSHFNSYDSKVKGLYEVILNNGFSSLIISTPPSEYLANICFEDDVFQIKKVFFVHFIPSFLKNYSCSYLSLNGFLDGASEKVDAIVNGNLNASFLAKELIADIFIPSYFHRKKHNLFGNNLFISIFTKKYYQNKKLTYYLHFMNWIVCQCILENQSLGNSNSNSNSNAQNL